MHETGTVTMSGIQQYAEQIMNAGHAIVIRCSLWHQLACRV